MIVVKLEMWPGGDETRKYDLGRTYVWNDATITNVDPKRGNYEAAVMRRGVTTIPQRGGAVTKAVKVENYPRLSYNVWVLIYRVLAKAFDPKAPEAPDMRDPQLTRPDGT